jgi:hypothetical protein
MNIGTILYFTGLSYLISAWYPAGTQNTLPGAASGTAPAGGYGTARLINEQDNGYRGIWYHIGQTKDEYVHKYSGGLGTYPANHYPFSVYVPKVNKTFFCNGGTDAANSTLLHQVAYYDHKTGEVPRPTIVLDKATTDAHDNPVIQVDKDGFIWLFSTSHGKGRPSFVHKSVKPYEVDKFEKVEATKMVNGKKSPLDNFSYLQMYYTKKNGFLGLFTSYEVRPLAAGSMSCRDMAYMTSKDGVEWSEWKFLAQIEEGSYQTSGQWKNRIGTSFNYHPHRKVNGGLDFRTNLYYMFTDDNGKSWRTADGKPVLAPLTNITNEALVYDYSSQGLNVYINDVNFDKQGNPIILYEVGKGHAPGPANGMKQWHTAHWNGNKWNIAPVASSDHNYDMGSLYMEKNNTWKIIAPTGKGPQSYNTGGEISMLVSRDQGASWATEKHLTRNSEYNHSYPRRPVKAHPGFYAFWADGHGRKLSKSRLYFADQQGNTFMLPEKMDQDKMKPAALR